MTTRIGGRSKVGDIMFEWNEANTIPKEYTHAQMQCHGWQRISRFSFLCCFQLVCCVRLGPEHVL